MAKGEPAAKRSREEEAEAEEHEEDEEEDDEESSDEEEDSDDESESEFGADDFEGVQLNDEQLEKVNEAFREFKAELLEKGGDDQVPLIVGSPTSIRPVPSTKDEFKKHLQCIYVDSTAGEYHEAFSLQLQMALAGKRAEGDDEEEDEDEDEELRPDPVAGAPIQQEAIDKADKEIRGFAADKSGKERAIARLQLVAVLTDVAFGPDLLPLFTQSKDVAKAKAAMEKLSALWDDVLKEATDASMDEAALAAYRKLREESAAKCQAADFKTAGLNAAFKAK